APGIDSTKAGIDSALAQHCYVDAEPLESIPLAPGIDSSLLWPKRRVNYGLLYTDLKPRTLAF
ncbi:hypothetical protein PIB30_112975, partial [Stylosanthes scabra]|nr:hypothetical protein [Stylosanthes scabra]